MCINAISIYSYASLSPFKPVKSKISCYAIVKAVIKGGNRFGVGGPWTLWRTKTRGKKGRAFMRERLTSLNGNHNLYFSVTFFTRLINQGGRQTTDSLCEEVYAAGTKNYYVLKFFTCRLLASRRWSNSCVLIGFPSGQEGSLYSYFEKRFSEKALATNPTGILGGFEITVLHRNFERMARQAMDYVSEC